MAEVVFTGKEDLRILAAEDLKKAGVEGFTKTTFARGEKVAVKNDVANALVNDPALFGKFEIVEGSESLDLPETVDTNESASQTPENEGSASDAGTGRGARGANRGTTGSGTVSGSTSSS